MFSFHDAFQVSVGHTPFQCVVDFFLLKLIHMNMHGNLLIIAPKTVPINSGKELTAFILHSK